MILELRFMTIPFYVQGQLMTSISSIVVPLISNKFVEQSRMSMSMIINYWIPWLSRWLPKTLRWVTMVMEKSVYLIIRLTIRRRLLGLSQQFLQQNLNQSLSIIQSPRLQFLKHWRVKQVQALQFLKHQLVKWSQSLQFQKHQRVRQVQVLQFLKHQLVK